MITIRIEFYNDIDRQEILDCLRHQYKIIEYGDVKPTKRINSKLMLQYVSLQKKTDS